MPRARRIIRAASFSAAWKSSHKRLTHAAGAHFAARRRALSKMPGLPTLAAHTLSTRRGRRFSFLPSRCRASEAGLIMTAERFSHARWLRARFLSTRGRPHDTTIAYRDFEPLSGRRAVDGNGFTEIALSL